MIADDVRTVPFARPWITDAERRAVLDVLQGPILTHGPEGRRFETEFGEFLGPDAHCVSVSSCMAGLHLAYLHLGLGPGDEVVVPALTHAATAHAVEWVGATPVFVDCDPVTGNVTAGAIEPVLSPRTRAISVVHFAGIPCDMGPIMALAHRHGLKVVEDCAIALGSRLDGRHVGLFGDAGLFSFYPAKHITTGEGGMLVSRHAEVAAGAARLRAFGVDRTHAERSIPGLYDVPILGLNYRMSELHAALGRPQVRRLHENLARRRVNFEALRRTLERVPGTRVLDVVTPAQQSSHYCLSVVLEQASGQRRNEVVADLNRRGIQTSVYYPQPVPRMTYYRNKYGYSPERFPVAEEISDRSIALPVGPHLAAGEVDYMAAALTQVLSAPAERP
jgi:dTDP-4-amino-4,6-dideoxygalactose transaminase